MEYYPDICCNKPDGTCRQVDTPTQQERLTGNWGVMISTKLLDILSIDLFRPSKRWLREASGHEKLDPSCPAEIRSSHGQRHAFSPTPSNSIDSLSSSIPVFVFSSRTHIVSSTFAHNKPFASASFASGLPTATNLPTTRYFSPNLSSQPLKASISSGPSPSSVSSGP